MADKNSFTAADLPELLKQQDWEGVYPLILALSGFILYWFISQSEGLRQLFYRQYAFDKASSLHIFSTKLIGFAAMGVLPALICFMISTDNTPASYGFTFIGRTGLYSLQWITGLGALLMLLAFFSAGKPENMKHYPQVRAIQWSGTTILLYVLGWTLYLTAYEFLFRGILLFPLVKTMGVGPAIAVNIAMYSATHIPKGLKETIGAIPLGLVLCVLTLISGTLWIAIFTHLIMALTNSFRALYLNKEIKITLGHRI